MRSAFGSLLLLLMLAPPVGAWSAQPSAPGGDGQGTPPVRPAIRLILTPTARPLKSGEGYVSLHELFFPMLGIGVTDHFSIAGGVSVVPGAGSRVMIISSAYTPVRAGDLDLSCGLFYMKKTGGRGTPIPYVNATYGDAGLSATLGSGWRPGGGDGQGTLFFIGGFLLPLGDDTELISDFIAPPNADPAVVSLGTRVHANKLTAEFALIVPWNVRGTPGVPLPWTSVSIEF